MKATAQIFLSYAREDEEKVENLYRKLSGVGFKPWMDKKDILGGEIWELSIQTAIQRSDFFLACLSASSVTKRGVLQKEIRDALDIWRGMLDSDIYLVPVRLEDCELPESLRVFQPVDLFEKDGWTQLVKAIQVGMGRREVAAYEEPSPGTGMATPEEGPERVRSRNPFIVGSPVPPDRFIGREREVEAILDRLASPAHGSTAVSGEALIGKTSLLHYISRPEVAKTWGLSLEKCTFIFVDSQTIAPFSPMRFWRYVLKSLAARKVYETKYIEGLLQGDDVGGFELGELFYRIARDGKLVVLLLDEFEHIVKYVNPDKPDFLYRLRSLINRPAHGSALVLASRKPLHVLCQDVRFVGSPFTTSFTSLSLGSFSPGEANEVIDVYTQGTGVTFSDRDREFAYEISKGHPYQLQKVCFKVFQRHMEKMRQRK